MNILFVQNTDWLMRNPAQQHHLAELLSLREHQIRAIDFELLWRDHVKKSMISEREVYENISKIHKNARVTVIRPEIVHVPILDYLSFALTQYREIERQINEFQPDIIVSLGIFTYSAARLAKKYHLPLVYYWIDVSHRLVPQKFLQPLGWFVERRNLKISGRVLAINNRLQEYLIRMGAPSDRTAILGAGIDIGSFNPTQTGTAIRAQYGIKDDDYVLFFMGWLYHFSGLKEVISDLIKVSDPRMKLLIVGDGDAFADLRELREQNGLTDRVILCGKKPYNELPGYIAAADVCLLPSYPWEPIMQEIVPIKLYEYLAMGKPVISTALPGVCAEFGDNAGISYVDRPQDVVKAAVELRQKGQLLTLGNNGRRFVEQYDWAVIADRFEEMLYESIRDNIGD